MLYFSQHVFFDFFPFKTTFFMSFFLHESNFVQIFHWIPFPSDRVSNVVPNSRAIRVEPEFGENKCFGRESVWTLADCEWRAGRAKGVYRCRIRCLQISMSNADRVPCKCRWKCRWKCRKYIDLSRKKAQKNQNHMLKRCRIICWYTCIYIYTHKHTHTQKGSFSKHFHEKKCKKLGTDSKKCQCRLKRPANVEHMSMSMVPPNVDPIWSTSVYTLTRGGFKAKAPPLAARPKLTGLLTSMDLAAPTQRLILSHRTAVPHALYWFWTGFCRRPIPNQTMILVWLGIGRLQTSDFKKEQRKGFSGKHMGNHWNFWSNPYRARRLRD